MNHLTLSRYLALLNQAPPPLKPLTIQERTDKPLAKRRSLNEAAHKLPHYRR